jgi:two-component system sporulation sensor kinase B
MLDIYNEFILIFFYVFFLPAIAFEIARRKLRSRSWLFQLCTAVIFAFAMIMAMNLPEENVMVHMIVNGLFYDFREVPLVLGSLYGGPLVAVVLAIVMVTREILNNTAVELPLYVISLLVPLLFAMWISTKYTTMTLAKKVVFAMFTYIIVRVFIVLSYTMLSGVYYEPNIMERFSLILIRAIVMGLFVFFIEYIERLLLVQSEVRNMEKLKLVSGIAASVAHEVRNPLTAVRGFVQLLGNDEVSAENRKYFQSICLEELDRAEAIITDYLSLAKAKPEKKETICLMAQIQYVAGVLYSYARLQNVRVDLNVDQKAPLLIVGDRSKFRQALINLGKNAIEAMPSGGTLLIETKVEREMVRLTLQDTGIGMNKEQLARLGSPFYSTKEKGTGLGTMVAFSILRSMNGTIKLDSKVGVGTVITISFPQAALDEAAMDVAAAAEMDEDGIAMSDPGGKRCDP